MRTRNALTILLAIAMILSPISIAQAALNDANLLGYWNFDEPSGATVADFTANANDGTISGNPAWVPAGGALLGALDLDGAGDYVTVPGAGIDIANKSFSTSFWVNRDDLGQGYVIGHTAAGGNNHQLHIGFRNADQFTFAFWGNDMNITDAMWNQTTDWVHFVTTYDAATNQQTVYASSLGVSKSWNAPRGADFQGTGNLVFGGRLDGTNEQYSGLLDEVGVWDRVLTAGEAAQLYNAGTPLQFFSSDIISNVAIGDWGVGGSWDTGAVPASDNDVSILAGHNITVQSGIPAAAHTLDIAATGIVGVNDTLTVEREITIAASGALNIGSGGTVIAETASTAAITFADNTSTLDVANLSIETAIDLDVAAVNLNNNITIAPAGSLSMGATPAAYNAPTGSLDVQGTLSNTTDIIVKNIVMPAAYAIEDGRTLMAETGALGDVTFGTAAVTGTSTIDASLDGGVITGANLEILPNTTLVKNGPGKVSFSGTSTVGAGVTLDVNAGRLAMAANSAVETIELGGGTLELSGVTAGSYSPGLQGSLFRNAPAKTDTSWINLAGSTYQYDPTRVYTGDKAGSILTNTSNEAGFDIAGDFGSVECVNEIFWGPFGDLGSDWTRMVTAYSGRFTASETGTYYFHANSDDLAAMYIDFDNDGVFDAGDQVGNIHWYAGDGRPGAGDGHVELQAGESYNIMFMAQEDAGGKSHRWYIDSPSGPDTMINTSGVNQGGVWEYGETTYGAIAMTSTNINVTSASGLRANSDTTAEFGVLTLADILTVSNGGKGQTTSFTSISVGAGNTGGISASRTVSTPALNIGAGGSFSFSGGTLNTPATTLAGSGTVEVNSTLNGGVLTLAGGTFTAAGAGAQNYDSINAPAAQTIDISGGGTITTLAYDDGDAARTLNIIGNGTLAMGSTVNADDAVITIGGTATLSAASIANPMGVLGTNLTLNGGTFQTGGVPVDAFDNGMIHYGYHINNDGAALNLNNNGGMMGGGDPTNGPNYNGQALFVEGPQGTGLWYDGDGNFKWNGVINQNDNYSNMWLGYIDVEAGETGAWHFWRTNQDDMTALWIDLDRDGTFESDGTLGGNKGEQIMYNSGDMGVTLPDVGKYMVAFLHREGTGGSKIGFDFQSPVLSRRRVYPGQAEQNNLWVNGSVVNEAINMATTDVEVIANSNLAATTNTTATFGALTLTSGVVNVTGVGEKTIFGGTSAAAGATTGVTANSELELGALTVGAGADVTLGGTNVTATSIDLDSSATIRTTGNVDFTNYNEGGDVTALTVAGTGNLDMSGLGAAAATGTTFKTQETATLILDGATPLGGSTGPLLMDGGTIRISGVGSVAPSGAIASWKFDETSGGSAADSSGNGHNGTLTNGVVVNQASRAGSSGTSFYFDGANDYVSVPAGIDIANKSFTLAAWVKREAPAAGDYIMGQGPGNNNLKLHFGFRDPDNATLAFYANDSDHVDDPQYTDTGWHHLVGTYNLTGGIRDLYWDGVEQSPITNDTGRAAFQGLGEFLLGQANGSYFQGWLDDMYIYDSALSQADITQLYNATGQVNAINLSGTNIEVSNDSTLEAITSSTATFGSLSFTAAKTLTTEGADGSIIFADTTLAAGNNGFETLSNTAPGAITVAAGIAATIVKTGAADLVLDSSDPAVDVTGSLAWDVQEGALVAQAGSNPLGDDNAVAINGGEVILIAKDAATDPTFDNPVTSTVNGGTLTAGRDGDGFARIVTIGSGTNHLTLDAGGTLLAQTRDGYTLNVGGNVAGTGNLAIGAGSTVTVAGTMDAGSVTIDGSLTVAGAVNVNDLIASTGGSYAGPSDLTVSNNLTLNGDLDLSASTLVVDNANVTVNNGTLTVGAGNAANHLGSATPVASVDLSNGGGLALTGTSLTTKKLSTTGGTFDMGATGSFIATGDVVANPVSGPAQLQLSGGTLSLTGAGGVMPSGLRLHLDAADTTTVFEDEAGTTPAANGSLVARWNDKSGNGFDVTHNNAAQLPQFDDATNTLNGLPTLAFDADKIGRANDIGILGNDDRTVITVWHNATGTGQNYQHTFHMGSNNAPNAYGHSVSRGGNGGEIGNHFWGEGFNSTATTGLGQANIAISTWDGDGAGANGLDSWYVNGQAEGTYTRGPLTTAVNELLIGSRLIGPSEGIRGNIAEVLVFDKVLSADEMNDIGGYLSSKWGIAAPQWYGNLLGGMNLVDTDILMTEATTIDVTTDAILGDLTVDLTTPGSPVTLSFTGDSELRLNLASTTLADAVTGNPGLIVDSEAPKVNLGVLNLAASADPIMNKTGAGEWIITDDVTDAAANYTGTATFNVNAGTLTLGDTGLVGASPINVNNAALKLSSPTAATTYNDSIALIGDTTILAGKADSNAADVAVVTVPTLPSVPAQTITLGTTDAGYNLSITNPVVSDGLNLGGVGTVTLAGGGTVNTATVDPATTGVINVPTALTVANQLNLEGVPITDDVAMQVVGSNLANPTGTITVSGTAFTMGVAASVAPSGAIANWKFDETSGATAVDATGGNDGTIGGGIVLGQPARAGELGTSFYFPNGVNLVTAAGIALDNRSFTLAAWAKRENPNPDYFFGQGASGGNNALHAGFRNNQQATFAFTAMIQTASTPSSTTTPIGNTLCSLTTQIPTIGTSTGTAQTRHQ